MFQPTQKQSFIKGNMMSSSGDFESIMKQSIMLQEEPSTDSLNEQNISNVKQFLNEDGIILDDLKTFIKGLLDVLNNEEDNDQIEELILDNQHFLVDVLEYVLSNEDVVLNDIPKTQFAELFQQLQNILEKSDSELIELEGLSNVELIQYLTQLMSAIDVTKENDASELEIEDIVNEDVIEINEFAESKLVQLLTQLQSAMDLMDRRELPEKIARIFLPLLKEWTSMSKQYSREALNEFAANFLDIDDLEILKNVQELYEKRTYFQSKQMYGETATVTRSDVAQWINVALNQNQDQEQTHRVISTLKNETIAVPKMSVLNQQAIHFFQRLDSVQRIEAEMTTRVVNIIQQHMSIQQKGPVQSLSMVLTPEHLGTLQVNFSQVNGEMIVRIIASSSYAKEMLESNLHQLKHAFSPHQVQIVRGDDTIIEDDVLPQQEEQSENHQDNYDEQQEEQKDELITIDFTTLFEEALEEEEVMIND